MATTQVINTFKDGVLTSSKKVVVAPPINPETEKPQAAPKHPGVLNQADASKLAILNMLEQNEKFAIEARALRKKLLQAEALVRARTRERNSLRKAHQARAQQADAYREKIEDLEAKLFALRGDYKFLERENKRLQFTRNSTGPVAPKVKTVGSTNHQGTKPASSPKPSPLTKELIEEKTSPPRSLRAIAAKPKSKKPVISKPTITSKPATTSNISTEVVE
jgi:hypothetical protein